MVPRTVIDDKCKQANAISKRKSYPNAKTCLFRNRAAGLSVGPMGHKSHLFLPLLARHPAITKTMSHDYETPGTAMVVAAIVILSISISCCFAQAPASPASPELPDLSPLQGTDLVDLARQGMLDYLQRRAKPGDIPVPDSLKPLTRKNYPAAITLRSGGAVVAVEYCGGDDVCLSVISAAQIAMRSPRLPDRVDEKVLAGLTVELEVLGPAKAVSPKSVQHAIVRGLSGTECGRWPETVRVLPSAAYVLGLTPDQMYRGLVVQLRRRGHRDANGLPVPSVFVARHYVGYPGKPAIELFRGKVAPQPHDVDERAALEAAALIARFLAVRQDERGRFDLSGRDAGIADQAYLAWSLARLARRRPDEWIRQCAGRSLAAVRAQAIRKDGKASLPCDDPDEALAAAAMLAMALADDTSDGSAGLRRALLAGLGDWLDAPSTAPAGNPPGLPVPVTRGRCLATMALATDPACEPFCAAAKRALSAGRPATASDALWAFRAGVTRSWPPKFGDPNAGQGLTQHASKGPIDNRGGFATGSQSPSTYLTAQAVACMTGLLTRREGIRPETARTLERQLVAARAFCANMIFQAGEAYFTAEPDSMIGGVRARPGGAIVTAEACAAAIEALTIR